MKPLFYLIILFTIAGCGGNNKPAISVEKLTYPADLAVIKRSDWGWKKLQQSIAEHKINKITIHHGGVFFSDTVNVIDHIQKLQDWSRKEKKWIDIPYHFMIDLDGKIYETRPINYPGDTNTDYNVRGHALICVLGNYEEQLLSTEQLQTVIRLSAYLTKKYNIKIRDIKGHKDYTETLCPGKDLYQYLSNGTIQNEVAKLLAGLQ